MQTAAQELSSSAEFGQVVINDRLEEATDRLERIVRRALARNDRVGCDQVDAKLFSPTHEECERP
jgi:guanylate kinase